jgi:arylsulfatase A-like enzyme
MSNPKQQPNIVMVLTDDQGAWALGCAGNTEIHTPNLDRLAAEGTRFTNFFCASPVCSPARASILTGRIPSQHGIHDWLRKGNLNMAEIPNAAALSAGPEDGRAIEYLQGLRSYTDALAEHGYVCGLSGKWHLGDSLRPQKGFSYWHVYPWGGGNYHDAHILRDGQLEQDPRYLTDVITEGGLRFLDARAEDRRPFYLGVHYTAPHSPWDRGQHPEELTALYRDCAFNTCPDVPAHPWQINSAPRGRAERRRELLTGYYAAVSGLDRGVGQILGSLDRHGLRENTLVIFTSDNGMNMGHHGIWGKGNGTFPLNMYDTSVKVPMLMALPGGVPAGAVRDHLLSHYDILPTLLDYLDIENTDPTKDQLPGHSFAPLLRGEPMEQPDHVVVCDEYGPVRMIRTRELKYVHRYPYGPCELYDLRNDPNEEHNLVDEPRHAARVAHLRGLLTRWFVRYADPARDGAREPVSGKGQVDLAGSAGQGREAFADDWWYIDADGQRREDYVAQRQARYFTNRDADKK